MKKKILIYGFALALLALLLESIQYFYFVRFFPLEIYIAMIAIVFLGIGAWAGRKLTAPGSDEQGEFQPNSKAINHLGISDREMDVLQLIARGLSNKQIADQLYISIHTVKSHVSNILGKLDVERRTQAIQKARALKMIQ